MSQENSMLDLVTSLRLFGRPCDIPSGMDPMDYVELAVSQFPAIHTPIIETFTPNMCAREVNCFAGTVVVTEEHLVEHPFVLLEGEVAVWTKEQGMVHLKAPYMGVTMPGVKRVVFVVSFCRWITFHATQETNSEIIRKTVTRQKTNPLLEFNPEDRRKKAEEEYLLLS